MIVPKTFHATLKLLVSLFENVEEKKYIVVYNNIKQHTCCVFSDIFSREPIITILENKTILYQRNLKTLCKCLPPIVFYY